MLMYERIRNLRQDKDFTQTQMAEWLSVGQSTYSDYELGKLNIPLPTLVRIAQILGTSTDYLLNLSDDPTPPSKKAGRGV